MTTQAGYTEYPEQLLDRFLTTVSDPEANPFDRLFELRALGKWIGRRGDPVWKRAFEMFREIPLSERSVPELQEVAGVLEKHVYNLGDSSSYCGEASTRIWKIRTEIVGRMNHEDEAERTAARRFVCDHDLALVNSPSCREQIPAQFRRAFLKPSDGAEAVAVTGKLARGISDCFSVSESLAEAVSIDAMYRMFALMSDTNPSNRGHALRGLADCFTDENVKLRGLTYVRELQKIQPQDRVHFEHREIGKAATVILEEPEALGDSARRDLEQYALGSARVLVEGLAAKRASGIITVAQHLLEFPDAVLKDIAARASDFLLGCAAKVETASRAESITDFLGQIGMEAPEHVRAQIYRTCGELRQSWPASAHLGRSFELAEAALGFSS